ncbi:MAG: sodium/sugar symporter [Pseudomonadota bacterium]|nr:sodium/sugar symporter [Pseudomonadota bacterium]
MTLSTIDLVILAVYGVGIFALAQWVSRDKAGHRKTSTDYFLASKSLPWWAIGASLIAANISAEQIIGMSGSGYVIGLAIASYEWMAALTLLIVGKFFLPIFLRNDIVTMPQFLQQRYGPSIRNVMAVFWLVLYVFVNITSILWLGSLAITAVTGVDQTAALIGLAAFGLVYQLWGGLKAVALTDAVQVILLVAGGLVIAWITLGQIGGGDVLAGGARLMTEFPEKFDMILSQDSPHYAALPGLSVLIGGMWIMNLSYWGFNQYIIQRALAASSIDEAQKGVAFAAYLKLLMPLIVVLPGLAALMLAPDLDRPDAAYPTMMALLPVGMKGLVFAALVAAIIATLGSLVNSISTIFTLDLYAKARKDMSQRHLVLVGRLAAVAAMVIGGLVAQPLLGNFDQAFQFIQDFTGFFTPAIVVIFILGLFWSRASEAGALTAAIGGVVLSGVMWWLDREAIFTLPFMNRVGLVFLAALAGAIIVSLLSPPKEGTMQIRLDGVSYRTSAAFNIAAVGVILFLIAVYAIWW